MFTATFHEIQTRPDGGLVTATPVWHTFTVPAAPRTLNKAKDRVIHSLSFGEPVRIPPRAAFVLSFQGETVLAREYGSAAGIPALLPGDPGGRYDALPAEMWAQLNPREDNFVVQLKLRKMPPGAARDPGTGGQYVYGVTRLIVQVAAAPPAAATDTDRALLI